MNNLKWNLGVKSHSLKIPKRNLLAETKTDLMNEASTLDQIIRDMISHKHVELFIPPGIWYGYKDEWLEYSARVNQQEYKKGSLPTCGSYFYEVVVPQDKFIELHAGRDPNKILKIDSTRAFDHFTERYMITYVPYEWRSWFSDPSFDMPLEFVGKRGEEPWMIHPRYIDWRSVMIDYAGLEIKPYQKKREGKIKFNGKEIESWYSQWTTGGGVVWRPLSCLKLNLLYEFDLTKHCWIETIPPQRTLPQPRSPEFINPPSINDIKKKYESMREIPIDTTPVNEVDPTTWPRTIKKKDNRPHLQEVIQQMEENTSDKPTQRSIVSEKSRIKTRSASVASIDSEHLEDRLFSEDFFLDELRERRKQITGEDSSDEEEEQPVRRFSIPEPKNLLEFKDPSKYDLRIATSPSVEPKTPKRKEHVEKKQQQQQQKPPPLPPKPGRIESLVDRPSGTWRKQDEMVRVIPTLPKNFADILRANKKN